MNFGEILKKAWKVIWKHKILWLFGILAGCSATNSGLNQLNNSSSSNPIEYRIEESREIFGSSSERAFEEFFRSLADIHAGVWVAIAIGLLIAIIVFSVLFLMLGNLGITGVVKGTSLADEADEEEKPLSLKAVFNGLKPTYWKVFLFNLGYRVAIFIAGSMLFLPIILLGTLTCGLGFLLLAPINWAISLMVIFTIIVMVEEELSVFKAISRAWKLLLNNVWNIILMFLILGFGEVLISALLSFPIFVSLLPLIINVASSGYESITTGLVVSGILLLISIPVTILLNGVLRTYVWSAWTLTYKSIVRSESAESEVLK